MRDWFEKLVDFFGTRLTSRACSPLNMAYPKNYRVMGALDLEIRVVRSLSFLIRVKSTAKDKERGAGW